MSRINLNLDLKSFFQTELFETARKQGHSLSVHTADYLAGVLDRFSKTRNYLKKDPNSEKMSSPTLALLWLESQGKDKITQYKEMLYLGDFALFTSGFFSEKIQGSNLDMDYYIALGGKAYERAGQIQESIAAERALNVFFDLAEDFKEHVELFNELSLQSQIFNERDILRLYEKWLKTRNERLGRILNEKGIIPGDPTKA